VAERDPFDELIGEICADILRYQHPEISGGIDIVDVLREKLKPIWEKARNWDCIDWSDTPLLEKTMKKKIELERSFEAIKKLIPEFPLDPCEPYRDLYLKAVAWWKTLRTRLGDFEN